MQKLENRFYLFIVILILTVSSTQGQGFNDYIKVLKSVNVANQKQPVGLYLIEVEKDTKLSSLRESGIEIKRRISDNLLVISTTNSIEPLKFITNSWGANNKWKLSNELLFNERWPSTLTVKTKPGSSPNRDWIRVGENIYIVNNKKKNENESLINDLNIIYIGSESNDALLESRVLDMNLNPNKINLIHREFPEVNGEGITVSIKEQQYNPLDIDLITRDVASNLSSPDENNHATEMATIIAGAGNSFITGRGVADHAMVTSSDFENVLPDKDIDYQQLNAFVQNHSYGTEIENFYGSKAEAFDLSANNNPTLLHIFSSGNQGLETTTEGTYAGIDGYANLSGNFKMAKNVLIVGSIDTVGNIPVFVSNGPSYDGRIKPEIVAYSAVGSSNSSALVSGVTTLLQHQYKLLKGDLPASALVKALLINEADDANTKGIDFKTGFGNVNGFKSLKAIQENRYISGSINNGGEVFFDINVPSNSQNLKITLVWNDPAGSINSQKALVNDLDLKINNAGTDYLPWILNTTPSELQSLPSRGIDRLNNVEQVSIESPVAGTYQIQVTGFDVPEGPQEFYIVYGWDTINTFKWTFPTSMDNMPYNGESNSYFRWESTLSSGTGVLEYSINNGTTWKLINNKVPLSKGYYNWNTSHTSGIAKARMTTGEGVFETELFSTSKALKTYVGFNCSDSVLLQWNKDPNALGYDLYIMDKGPYLEQFQTVTDTSIIIKTNNVLATQFSVKPIYDNNITPIGSPTFDYNLLNGNCYLNLFTGLAKPDHILLSVNLALTYGVDYVEFEKYATGVYTPLGMVDVTSTTVDYSDFTAVDGNNIYRAIVHFDSGEELVSDEIEVYYLNHKKAILFPNPLTAEDLLNIFTKDFEGAPIYLRLYSRLGQLVYQIQLTSDRNSIILPEMESGLYLYSLETPEGEEKGKLIISN